MHSRLEIEGRDRRRRAVVLAIDVDLASRRYRDDDPRRAITLLVGDLRCFRLHRPRERLRRRGAG